MTAKEKVLKLLNILQNPYAGKGDIMTFAAEILEKSNSNVDYAIDIRIARALESQFPCMAHQIYDNVSDYRNEESGYIFTNIYKEFFTALVKLFNLDDPETAKQFQEMLKEE